MNASTGVGSGAVTREEFILLRRSDKEVSANIEFVSEKNCHEDTVIFGPVPVANSLDYTIHLYGHYNRKTKTIGFNFMVAGERGSICRVDVNGPIHGDAGRTHKQELMEEADQRKDLPHAKSRPDLEGKTPRQVWEILCRQANIDHTGTFVDP
jgi:hypothetical protein